MTNNQVPIYDIHEIMRQVFAEWRAAIIAQALMLRQQFIIMRNTYVEKAIQEFIDAVMKSLDESIQRMSDIAL